MVNLNDLNMAEVRDHYMMRERLHRMLRGLFEAGHVREYVRLALGITEGPGNYRASEHIMGPRILAVAGAEQDSSGGKVRACLPSSVGLREEIAEDAAEGIAEKGEDIHGPVVAGLQDRGGDGLCHAAGVGAVAAPDLAIHDGRF